MKAAFTVTASLSFLTIIACSEGREPELYLIPEGYVGSFYILHNIPGGEPQTYENGARVYDIPDDGVLLIQSDTNSGTISSDRINYYYESDDGSRRKIGDREATGATSAPEKQTDEPIYIYGPGIGLIEPVRHCQIYTSDFHVGTKAQILDGVGHFDIYSDRGVDSIPDEVFLEACKSNQP